jgi:hypothetical protein
MGLPDGVSGLGQTPLGNFDLRRLVLLQESEQPRICRILAQSQKFRNYQNLTCSIKRGHPVVIRRKLL